MLSLMLLTASCQSVMWAKRGSEGVVANPVPCSFSPPLAQADHQTFTQSNASSMLVQHRKQPVTAVVGKKSLSLNDCRSLALTNNLDVHAARLDELTRAAVAESIQTKTLPRLLFYADLSEKDNQMYSYADVLGQEGRAPRTGREFGFGSVTDYYTSQERSIWRYVLETRWNITDAALAWYQSKSSLNDTLKAHYQRVRVAQKLIATVDQAYFRLLSLQNSLPVAEELVSLRSKVVKDTKKLVDQGVVDIAVYNQAKQKELRVSRILSKIRHEMEKQRNTLASAIGISPDRCVDGGFHVTGGLSLPSVKTALCDLELEAVHNRPEAFDAGLTHINSINELRSSMIKGFPKISLYWKITKDKDKYLYRKDWKEVGAYVYFDLMDWFGSVKETKAAKAHAASTHAKTGIVAVAIASQVRVAALDYSDAAAELKTVQASLESTEQVWQSVKQKKPQDEMEKLALQEAKAAVLQDTLDRNKALGEVNAAFAELRGAMGTNYREPLPCS